MRISFSFLAALLLCAAVCIPKTMRAGPVKVILDTDMSSDCDDAGALAVLNALADQGRAELLACVADGHDKDKAIAATINAINTYYGRPDVPIGTYYGPEDGITKSRYTAKIRDEFPHTALPDDQEPRSVDVYRRALAEAPDGSVKIVSVGFLCNLRDLLISGSDAASPLTGVELVRRKVKQLVVMGGDYPEAKPNFNLSHGFGTAQYVIEHWPTPVLFSGGKIGTAIPSGHPLINAPASDPVRRVYQLYTYFNAHASWDLTAVLAAAGDVNLYWNLSPSGYCKVSPDGGDKWYPTPDRGHSFLLEKMPTNEVGKALDALLMAPPRGAIDGGAKIGFECRAGTPEIPICEFPFPF